MSNWISVDERMPQIGTSVLVYSPRSYQKFSVEIVYRRDQDTAAFHTGWNKGEGEYEVTHWMNVPTPPKP